jgi:4-hydroxybenzoate polyprenyltransferase
MELLLAVIHSMRPRQWVKNGFLLAALVFDRQLFSVASAARVGLAIAAFCLLSSAVYIFNDLRDIESDRHHPRKRLRPIASGRLPAKVAYLALALCLLIALPLAAWLSAAFFGLCLGYLALNLAYSTYLKHIPILDILVLASFYVIRVSAGVLVISVSTFSPWIFVFTTFLALFLGVGKRRAELALLDAGANIHRRSLEGYTLPLLDQWLHSASTMTIMTYSLYTFFATGMPENHLMMVTIPCLIYGMFRYSYLVQVGQRGGSPEEVLLSDRPLQIDILIWGGLVMLFLYVFPQ